MSVLKRTEAVGVEQSELIRRLDTFATRKRKA
jgi:hypothetical protein